MYECMSGLNATELKEPAIKHFYKLEVQISDWKPLLSIEKGQ